ncbi:MAG: sigma 54-interacting transcriptional regulator [Archangiaceae bacterium]|nr:sigma 54-interacting transcriptional regulator [Archangiaceae bacterium]
MPALLLLSGPAAGLRREVTSEVILGRSPSCDIPLEDSKVSRRHARIAIEEGTARVSDLGSRNGTIVNGEKIEAEAVLLPGDRVQVGDTTVLYEPPTRAALTEREEPGDLENQPVEELLPAVGPEASLYGAGVALLSATSEAMVLRRAAEELARGVSADKAAALLGGTEGLLTAAVVGAEQVEVPRSLVRGALERKEASRKGGLLCAPLLASGGAPFGILYAERPEPFTADAQRVCAALGRLAGEAFAAVRARNEHEASSDGGQKSAAALVGTSRQFRKTVEQIRRAAAVHESVVLWGENGTGRLLKAQYIHSRSPRALGPLVVVDCRKTAVQVEEELFGRASAAGVPPASSALLRADGGTLVLRQIEAIPRHTAERLARLLSRKVAPARAGGEEPIDVRLIATCHAPTATLVSRGELDAELSKAVQGVEIESLALRDMKPDVPLLFEHFAARVARARRKEPPTLSPDARRLLGEYAWPGNVEELKGVAERLALLYAGTEVPALKLPPEVQEGGVPEAPKTLAQMIQRLERDAISEALREARGKKIKAAAILGISRPTLDKKIEDYQLVVEKRRL